MSGPQQPVTNCQVVLLKTGTCAGISWLPRTKPNAWHRIKAQSVSTEGRTDVLWVAVVWGGMNSDGDTVVFLFYFVFLPPYILPSLKIPMTSKELCLNF